jgi:hypothetical protein
MLVEQWVMVWEAWALFPPDSEVSVLSQVLIGFGTPTCLLYLFPKVMAAKA